MKKLLFPKTTLAALYLLSLHFGVIAQNSDPACSGGGGANGDYYPASAFFNYGSGINMRNTSRSTDLSIGQHVIGTSFNTKNTIDFGYWGQYLIPPFPPTVLATQGDLLDRIQVSWAVDPLGALPTQGFKIYRDTVFLAFVDNNTRNYNDFNVIAGRPYHYEVRGVNLYGEGSAGKAIGFQVPNGTVTGWVQTLNGSPVPDAMVTLNPMQGYSLKFGPMDGAFAASGTGLNPFLPASGDWTMTFWIKTQSATANAGLIHLSPFPLYLRALNSAGGQEGVEVATSSTGAPFLSAVFADSTKNGWHHVALSYDGSGEQGRLYIDGVLNALAPMLAVPSADSLTIGSFTGTGGWDGYLDELRIYHQRQDELSLQGIMMGTASAHTPNLSHYWKMDEELGTKSFDVVNRHRLFFCGPVFDIDRPNVHTAGETNEQGYYSIESANYGTGTIFLAEPSKNFYAHRALKMVRNEADYATLPDFSITPKATLELWVNSAGPDDQQCLISKKSPGNDFQLLLKPNGLENEVWLYLNGEEHNFGNLGMGYQHLAFTIDSTGSNRHVTGYKNGMPFGTPHSFPSAGNWSDPAQNWVLGARASGGAYTDNFGGLFDEVALYDTTLSAASILEHFQNSREMQEKGLRVYFALDEGNGSRLNNSGSVFLAPGTNVGSDWSNFAANQMTSPHLFTPKTRQVTLNPSVTSVDQVDFIDRSTVAVTGFVRYKNTDCFAKNVEILVNGASFSPKIFTDSTGRFVIDFDPGTTARLEPMFEDHVFTPAFWDLNNIVSPVAGILFNDVTTRRVKGEIAGGLCKRSIIKAPAGMGQGTVCIVKVRTADGCLERQITLDNVEGEYEFNNLPPVEGLVVSVTEHSDPDIKTFFQVSGGVTVDLTQKDTILDFIYFAPPTVKIASGLDPYSPACSTIVLAKDDAVTVAIQLVEEYVGGDCPLDSASFHIINGFADETTDTTMSGGTLLYKFIVGDPNPSPPFLKTLQILGTSLAGREGSLVKQGVVTGIRNKLNTFTTLLPETPTAILRDPPGDGSYAFLEKNTQTCQEYNVSLAVDVGGSAGYEAHLGGNVEIVAAPLGVGTIVNTGIIADYNVSANLSYTKTTDSTFQTCVSFGERLATDDGDLFVGGENGADLFMGTAFNIIFGFADLVSFNDTFCSPEVKIVLNVEPGQFSTVFVYSEFYIANYVMPYLEALAADPNAGSSTVADYVKSVERWQGFLDNNDTLKARAALIRNLSFDAGVSYEYSETCDTSYAVSVDSSNTIGASFGTNIGYQLNEFGTTFNLNVSTSRTKSRVNGQSLETAITTGYVLTDDDPGDAFSVDVAMDSVYRTPVFRLKAGQSSCPWEPGTANREGPNLALALGSQTIASNIPANEAAVFKMNLGNLSATNEDWTYGFTAIAATNPDGAVIKLNGQPLNNNTIQYIVPYGESIPITLTVERGPLEYDYDNLQVALVSECELERNFALSIPVDNDPNFFSAINLGVHFIRPCSEVNINVPEQNWVVFPDPLTPGPDDERRITVSGYDTLVGDFQLIRIQYRRSDGDGTWINIPGISDRYNPNWSGYAALPNPKPPVLQPGFTQFFWQTTGLSDGPYEIRAVAVCTGDASDKPGYSQVIKGRIDREPPSLVGTPQPSDGVYHVGDEVSFTFNKHINCNKLIPADLTQPNNVGLYDAETGQLIDIQVTCFENKIILAPNFQNQFFENKILRAELHDIEDLTGNKRDFIKWEFYVDRNELAWLTDSVGMTKYEDQGKTVSANIHNRGGYPVPFTIQDIPPWVHVVPDQGTLAANEIRPISFTVDSSLAFGLWTDSITLHTEIGQNPFFMGGDERLPLGVRVICRPPNWNLNAGLFENSENMVLELNVEGVISTDVEDIVVAYIGDTICGKANVQYAPQVGKYLAYLTIYGNPYHVLQPLRLEIWDASACLRYAVQEDYFLFQPDDVIGDPLSPQVIHTNNLVLRDLNLGFGWNWLSFNLDFPDPEINAALSSLQSPENDMLKSQSAFSIYFNGAGWLGTLNTLGNTGMYVYRADVPDTLKMTGNVLDPATTPIPVVTGWNWIGYVPNYSLPINEALSSLTAQTGDLIKSQLSFAQYLNPSFGWVGNLKYMSPPNGYQIKLAAPGTLIYPPPSSNFGGGTDMQTADRGPGVRSNFWTVDPTQFEYSSTLIGMLQVAGENATTETMELGAFVGSQVRGSGTAIYIPPLESYLFFLTTYSNTNGELINYKLYDNSTGDVQALTETRYFAPDQHSGSVDDPVPFSLVSTGTHSAREQQFFEVQPNPFQGETMFRFSLAASQEVRLTISDMSGKAVAQLSTLAQEGMNSLIWKGQSDLGGALPAGVYFVRLQTESGSVVKKVVRQ